MSHIPYQLTGDAGLRFGHDVIDELGRARIAPTAGAYEVWLTYLLGTNADLKRKVDQILASGAPLTDDLASKLHDEFFSQERLAADAAQANESLAAEISGLITTLQSAGERTGAYGKVLNRSAGALKEGLDMAGLRDVIAGLADATMEMATHNEALTNRLNDATRDMEAMRSALVKVRAEAMTDGMTGVSNRKHFDDTLHQFVTHANRHRSNLSLMMVDIDHFKRFNDTWGHQTGDQIIRFLAVSMKSVALPEFCVARYGGEEFAIIMPNTNLREASTLAENLRAKVESKKLYRRSTSEDLGRVTISIGVALYRHGEKADALVERADACLYASKRGGRNRVTTDASPQMSAA